MRLLALIAFLGAVACNPSPAIPVDIDSVIERARVEARDRGLDLDRALVEHKISFVRELEAAGRVSTAACLNTCSSNIECSGILQLCKFCSFGSCSATRPELPTPTDAGVDAP